MDTDTDTSIEIETPHMDKIRDHNDFVLKVLPTFSPQELARILVKRPDYFKQVQELDIDNIRTMLGNNELLTICTAYLTDGKYDNPYTATNAYSLGLSLATEITGIHLAKLLAIHPCVIKEITKSRLVRMLSKKSVIEIVLTKQPTLIPDFDYMEFSSAHWTYMCLHSDAIHTVAKYLPWYRLTENQIVTLVTKHPSLMTYIDTNSVSDRTYCRLIKTLVQTENTGKRKIGVKVYIDWRRFKNNAPTFNLSLILAYRSDFYHSYDEIMKLIHSSESEDLGIVVYSIEI